MAGIYLITIGKYFYVGLSGNIENRKREHKRELRKQTHRNPKMQKIYNKYKSLKFEILEHCEDNTDILNQREIFWMTEYELQHPELEIMNLKSGGNRPTYTYEAKERISRGKSKKEYDWEQRYIVYNSATEEILYVGDILDISKTLKINLNTITNISETWCDVLGCTVKIMEELESSILDWINDPDYFEGIL